MSLWPVPVNDCIKQAVSFCLQIESDSSYSVEDGTCHFAFSSMVFIREKKTLSVSALCLWSVSLNLGFQLRGYLIALLFLFF